MDRRGFLCRVGAALLCGLHGAQSRAAEMTREAGRSGITLFLCGDVMTGRGIDQALPHPGKPHLYEPWMRSAVDYVKLAERESGGIPRPVEFSYVWGDALEEWRRMAADCRIVNLETAVTTSEDAAPGKGIHYRMHPANVPVLTAAGIDCCALANNHVLDWGRAGLEETLEVLRRAGLRTAGAGRDGEEAAAPAVIEVPGKGRVLVFAWGMESSGVPSAWAATGDRPGVNFLDDLSPATLEAVGRRVRGVKRPGDMVVASIHWGGNWGFGVSREERAFARGLVGAAGVDLVHGHSSHHVKGIEVHRGKLILYGCGDFLNDYEGIRGYGEYRGDLALMYFPALDPATGRLLELTMTPTRTRRFRVGRAPEEGIEWLSQTLNREGRRFGTRVERGPEGRLLLRWDH
jgi:poly-gamma-glutamate capsule biosynthesis protein CapA/YwtB (metallophosphatase superfamily)